MERRRSFEEGVRERASDDAIVATGWAAGLCRGPAGELGEDEAPGEEQQAHPQVRQGRGLW